MMFDSINEMAILVSALLALALGSIWYSPLAFGTRWLSAAGLTESDFSMSRAALTRALIFAFLGNVVMGYVIARMIALAVVEEFSLIELGVLLVLLLGAGMSSVVVWEKKNFMYLAIHVGYAALVVCFSIIVIALWPW